MIPRYYVLYLFAFCCVFLNSCHKEPSIHPLLSELTILYEGKASQINNSDQLNDFVKVAVSSKDVEIINSTIEKASDEKGDFFLIRSSLLRRGQMLNFVIPLEKYEGSENKTSMYIIECTMTCNPSPDCTGCNQTVITRCESQTCTCSNNPEGSCSSVITF